MSQELSTAPTGYSVGSLFERVATLEARMTDTRGDVTALTAVVALQHTEFDKIKTRLTLATGIIVGVSVALKIVPPEVGELIKHAMGG